MAITNTCDFKDNTTKTISGRVSWHNPNTVHHHYRQFMRGRLKHSLHRRLKRTFIVKRKNKHIFKLRPYLPIFISCRHMTYTFFNTLIDHKTKFSNNCVQLCPYYTFKLSY